MASQPENFLVKDFSELPDCNVMMVSTAWNKEINDALVSGAEEVLAQYPQIKISKTEVPGCVELGFALRQFCRTEYLNDKGWSEKTTVLIAFGCVIRGGTPHFDYVCENVNNSITALNTTQNVPIIFGVLTLENEAQAWERLGGVHGHKGKEAAQTALAMLDFQQKI